MDQSKPILAWPAGASFFYAAGTVLYEAQEVRAFGLLLQDLVFRIDQTPGQVQQHQIVKLQGLVQLCVKSGAATQRPEFSVVLDQIMQLMKDNQ